MTKIAIVCDSGFEHEQVQVGHVKVGFNSTQGSQSNLFKVEGIASDPEKLNDYNVIIFGSSTYMRFVSASFKAFMNESFKAWLKKEWKDKIATGFINSHSKGCGAIYYFSSYVRKAIY